MKIWIVCLVSLSLVLPCFAPETYKGKVDNVTKDDRGIKFDVVIYDSQNKELERFAQFVSAGVMTAAELKNAVKNVVDRMTQEFWAHTEGAEEFMTKYKTKGVSTGKSDGNIISFMAAFVKMSTAFL